VKPFIQSSAEDDILRQFNWYVEQGVPEIARRFRVAVVEAINALMAMPAAGAPQLISNPALRGVAEVKAHLGYSALTMIGLMSA
jgi:plasmid stabilization system protein ParE